MNDYQLLKVLDINFDYILCTYRHWENKKEFIVYINLLNNYQLDNIYYQERYLLSDYGKEVYKLITKGTYEEIEDHSYKLNIMSNEIYNLLEDKNSEELEYIKTLNILPFPNIRYI